MIIDPHDCGVSLVAPIIKITPRKFEFENISWNFAYSPLQGSGAIWGVRASLGGTRGEKNWGGGIKAGTLPVGMSVCAQRVTQLGFNAYAETHAIVRRTFS